MALSVPPRGGAPPLVRRPLEDLRGPAVSPHVLDAGHPRPGVAQGDVAPAGYTPTPSVYPPSITSRLPVTQEAASETKYLIAPATSWGVPRRFTGVA